MENAVDSSSESDISDSWAVIDDYSSLEWNNEIRLDLGPPECDFAKSRLPRSSSFKSELSDEDSIEVLAEDHTDNLSDKGAEIVQDEEWTETDHLASKEDIHTGTCRPNPDLSHSATHLKKNHKLRESSSILIALLIMGILGGLGLGYIWASHSCNSEELIFIQPGRSLLTKLENEIKFLRRQLRSAQFSPKSAVSKHVPVLDNITKQDLHINMKEKQFKDVYPRMYSINDFIVKSPVLQNNFSNEYCLASERPQTNESVWANNYDDNVSVNIAHTSSSSKVNGMKTHLELNTGVDNIERNQYTVKNIPYDGKQIEQTFEESNEKVPFEPIESLPHVNTIDKLHSSDVIANVTSKASAGNEKNMPSMDRTSDPRPFTKLRTTVERIYTILSVINNDNRMVLPTQLELLSILPQNIVALDLSKGRFTTSVHDKITSFTVQMQDTTQKMFADIDSSINIIVQHIALKIKEIETFNKKQICNLRTSLESSADIDLLVHLNREPIFQKCVQEGKQNYHNDFVKSENKFEVKGTLKGSTEMLMPSKRSFTDQKERSHQFWMVKDKKFINHKLERRNKNENLQEVGTHLNVKSEETISMFGDNESSDLHKKSPKTNKSTLENKSHLEESRPTDAPVQPEAGTYHSRKSKIKHSDKEMKPKIVKAAKNVNLGPLHSKLHVDKKHKSGVKKSFSNKENKYYNESHAKDQKNMNASSKWVVNTEKTSNVSGEWATKMANGRAEQRRRDHQSDWVFDRSKSRTSNRKKIIKESYWHNDRDSSGKILNSGVYNKTMPLKDQASKSWNKVKRRVKKNLWKPFIESAKLVKKAFNKFHNKVHYHSQQE